MLDRRTGWMIEHEDGKVTDAPRPMLLTQGWACGPFPPFTLSPRTAIALWADREKIGWARIVAPDEMLTTEHDAAAYQQGRDDERLSLGRLARISKSQRLAVMERLSVELSRDDDDGDRR